MRSNKKWWKIGLLLVLAGVMLLVRYKGILYTGVHPVMTYVESRRISGGTEDYKQLEDGRFVIRYKAGDREAANRVETIAAAWGSKVLDYFGYQPSDPIDIIIFSREEDLKGVLRIPHGQSATGAYAGGMINLLSPDSLLGMNQDPDSLVNVFVHELAHLAMDGICKGNYPLWFTEGSALYVEYALLDYEWGSGLPEEPDYTMEDLTYRFHALDDQKAYRQSFLLVKGLVDKYGKDSYMEFLHRLGSGQNFEKAFGDVFGIQSAIDIKNWRSMASGKSLAPCMDIRHSG